MERRRRADRWSIGLRRFARGVYAVGALSALALAAFTAPSSIQLRTADRNADGRPDVWRYYDRSGRLIRIESDTNFDGRPDVEESYVHDRLVRRESDRNFDDQVDLIEEFDENSGQHRQSTVDTDFDGTADLLVLFSNGRPVFSQWANALVGPHGDVTDTANRTDARLSPVRNPFSSTARIRTNSLSAERSSFDANESPFFATGRTAMAGRDEARATRGPDCAFLLPAYLHLPSLRGPPFLSR